MPRLQPVARRDVRPTGSQTRAEMARFRVQSWPEAARTSTWVLLVLLTAALCVFSMDLAVRWVSSIPRRGELPLVTPVVALLTALWFLRTDPPGGTGGLVGDQEEQAWSRRKPGPVHWALALLLVVVALLGI